MDSSSFDGSDLSPLASDQTAGGSARQPIPWLRAALAIGFAAALVNTILGELVSPLQDAVINNPFLYQHQIETIIALETIITLVAPALAMVFALRHTRAGSRADVRQRAWRAIGLALGAMLILALGAQFVGHLLIPAPSQASSPADMTAQINEMMVIQSGLAACSQGIGLIFALYALTGRLAPGAYAPRRGERPLDWALAGALVGLVTSAIAQLNRITLLSAMAVRMAQVGVFACVANSGASCFPQQMLEVALYSILPALVGAAIGGVVGGALASRAGAPQAPESALRNATAPTRRRSRFVAALQYIAFGAVGALYAVYTLALLYVNGQRPYGPADPIAHLLRALGWALLLSGLALATPALWLALASAPTGGSQQINLRWLTVGALALALAAPASVFLLPGLSFGVLAAQFILEAFVVGATAGFIWSPPRHAARSRSAWTTGMLAAAPVWIGASLVCAALVGGAFYSASQPTASGATTCHGLACGALLMVVLVGATRLGVDCVILGLPAALFGGGLSALIRARAAR